MSMARILFLTERYPPDAGGVSASAGRIARSLAALGAQVDVVAWTRTLAAGQVAAESGNPAAFRMGRFREWDTTMPHTLNLLDALSDRTPYDLIWGHYLSLAGFLAVWFGRLRGVRSVVSIRGNDLDRDVFPPGDFARLEWTLKHADAVTAVTLDLARKARALSGRDDVAHLQNVVDTDLFHPGAEKPAVEIAAGESVLGFCGELREKKGLTYLLDALRTVRERRPARLLVIGEVRPSEMPRLLQMLGPGPLIDHHIQVTGPLVTAEEVNRYLQLCDVYLQPSLWDGMPNALLEAMAAGCGCIASDAGGIPEMIESGVNGVILPRRQLHQLGEVVLEWLDAGEEFRQRIRRGARERMVRDFHPDRERAALQTLLGRLIPSSVQTPASAAPARSQV
jgi:glycosyltransferase involved in cell wall biosynthesis